MAPNDPDPVRQALLQVVYAEYRVLLSCQRTLLAFARTALAIAVALLHSNVHPVASLALGLLIVIVGALQYASMSSLVLAGRPAWKNNVVGWLGCAMGWHALSGAVLLVSAAVAVGLVAYGDSLGTPVVL